MLLSIGRYMTAKNASLLGCALAFFLTPGVAVYAAQGTACTDNRVKEQQKVLQKFVQDNPNQQMAVVNTIAEVENEYGGEVPKEKQCEALDKVLNVIAGGGDRRTPIKR